jgi:hypothetical protein
VSSFKRWGALIGVLMEEDVARDQDRIGAKPADGTKSWQAAEKRQPESGIRIRN